MGYFLFVFNLSVVFLQIGCVVKFLTPVPCKTVNELTHHLINQPK